MDTKKQDTASEPVQPVEDEFMDTGVLHERPKKVEKVEGESD